MTTINSNGRKENYSTQKDLLKKWYHLMCVGRKLDERAPNYLKQALGWSYHAPYAGHDGIQLAVGQVFRKNKDHLFPYYRDMLTCLSAGLSVEEILLNGLSKKEDIASGGRHMSNHFAKPEWNIHNVSSCTGNHTLHAVGVARGIKTYGESAVAISSQGESSLSEGYCFEAINGASREQLPVIFVVQDNGFGISVPKWEQTANEIIAENYKGIKDLRIIVCDGKDVLDSLDAMKEAHQHALNGKGPVMVYAECVRIGNHSNSDDHKLYRSDQEIEEARQQDPLTAFEKTLLQSELFSPEELQEIEEDARQAVLAGHKFVLKAEDPEPSSIYDYVIPEAYHSGKYPEGLPHGEEEGEKITLREALNQTLKEEFRFNPDTYMWGQDVAHKEKGGIFNVSKGMQQEFGRSRVFNAPIAEDFIVGTANGMSRYSDKIRIVIEGAEFADYFWPAMEQLIECSHDYWRSNGQFSPNVTIRIASGGYIGGGLYHSQNLEGTFTTLPGLRVVVPAFADDAAGLLRTAMRSEGPTLYLEPKAMYNAKQASAAVPEEFFVPFGKARLRREGSDLSVITYGNTVHHCLSAAQKIQETLGKEVEVLDLRSLVPLDHEAIAQTVAKTHRVLIVHEDKVFSGFGAELSAQIMEEHFEQLDAPVKRIGSTFTPVGFNRILERATLPSEEKIFRGMEELLAY